MPGGSSTALGSLFSTTSHTGHATTFAALQFGASCSMQMKTGQAFGACSVMTGPWSDKSVTLIQRMWPHELLAWLGCKDLDLILREGGFAGMELWSIPAMLSGVSVTFRLKKSKCLPKMLWRRLTEHDRREWKFSVVNPRDRCIWRSVRTAMCAASQLPDVDNAPAW